MFNIITDQLRQQAKRTAINMAIGYFLVALLIGAVACFAISIYLLLADSFPPATAVALTGLFLIGLACLALLSAIFHKQRKRHQLLQNHSGVKDVASELPALLTEMLKQDDANPVVSYIRKNPSQTVLAAASIGILLGISPAKRQKLTQAIQEFTK